PYLPALRACTGRRTRRLCSTSRPALPGSKTAADRNSVLSDWADKLPPPDRLLRRPSTPPVFSTPPVSGRIAECRRREELFRPASLPGIGGISAARSD